MHAVDSNLIPVHLTEGQLRFLHALAHETAIRYSRERVRPAALEAIDVWQRLDEALDAWEREEMDDVA